LRDGSRAVAFLNRGATVSEITVSWEAIGYPANISASLRDVWARKDLGKMTGKFSAQVESHGVVVVTVKP